MKFLSFNPIKSEPIYNSYFHCQQSDKNRLDFLAANHLESSVSELLNA